MRYAQRLQRPNLRKATLKTTAAKVDYVSQEKVRAHCIALPAASAPSALLHAGCACMVPPMHLWSLMLYNACMLQGDKNTLEYRIFFEQSGEQQRHCLWPASGSLFRAAATTSCAVGSPILGQANQGCSKCGHLHPWLC